MNKILKRLLTVGAFMVLFAETSYALKCDDLKHMTGVYFKMHFSQHTFDNELSERTLENFIKSWDPGKIYFLESDVIGFRKKFATQLDDMIQKDDCTVIDDVVDVYAKRYQQRQKLIAKLINKKFDFTKDEYMAIDRKKMKWAKTNEEIESRWRKRIKFSTLQLNNTLKDITKVREKLKKRYALALKRHNGLSSDDAYSSFLNAFSNSLDPHSTYMAPEQLEDFRISTRLSLEGIGAVLRSEDGFTTIQSLVPGGAAFKTKKVKTEDKIIAVAQGAEAPVDVIDMDLREVVKLIRGARGTEVRLTLVREESGKSSQLIVPIIREKIQLKDRAAKSYVHEVNVKKGKGKSKMKVGVIDLPSFYMDFEGRQKDVNNFKSSSADMKREILKLKKEGVDAIVVDLRSNGGGALDESITISGLFFDSGPVVQIKDPRGATYVQKDEDGKTFYDGPLVVMINRQSASASEIFAGAIQDYGRGIIVGDSHTFGKGTVQNLNDIRDLGAIKVTISKFYRPSGASTQLKGVESDIILPSVLDQYEIGEKHYDYALPWEKIKTSKYPLSGMVKKYVKQLGKRSKNRIASNSSYDDTRDAIKEFKESEKERGRVSLKKEEKKKEPKEVAKKDDEDDEDDDEHDLSKDISLQEALRITADYVQLLNKKKPGTPTLPELKNAEKVASTGSKAKQKAQKTP
jgi:carboxyl-terminal processing protease